MDVAGETLDEVSQGVGELHEADAGQQDALELLMPDDLRAGVDRCACLSELQADSNPGARAGGGLHSKEHAARADVDGDRALG